MRLLERGLRSARGGATLRTVTTATIAPTNAIAAATCSASWNPSRNCAWARGSVGGTLTYEAMIAPIMAMPSDPPTCLMLFSTAEPTPALSMGTEPMAAAVVGVIASDMPDAAEEQAGQDVPEARVRHRAARTRAASASSTSPAPISQRDPIRSESLPAIGATNTIRTVIGRNAAPAWIGE